MNNITCLQAVLTIFLSVYNNLQEEHIILSNDVALYLMMMQRTITCVVIVSSLYKTSDAAAKNKNYEITKHCTDLKMNMKFI